MKEIRFKLKEDEYSKAKVTAQNLGLRVSQFTKFLVCLATERNIIDDANFEDKGSIKRIKISAYFEPHQLNILAENAKLHGWSKSKEIAFRVRSTLSDYPHLYLEEVKKLDQVRIALDRVGRNINYIIKNRMVVVDDSNFKSNIDEILQLTETVHKIVISCVKQSKNRFLK